LDNEQGLSYEGILRSVANLSPLELLEERRAIPVEEFRAVRTRAIDILNSRSDCLWLLRLRHYSKQEPSDIIKADVAAYRIIKANEKTIEPAASVQLPQENYAP